MEPVVELDIAARAAEMLNDVSTTLELVSVLVVFLFSCTDYDVYSIAGCLNDRSTSSYYPYRAGLQEDNDR